MTRRELIQRAFATAVAAVAADKLPILKRALQAAAPVSSDTKAPTVPTAPAVPLSDYAELWRQADRPRVTAIEAHSFDPRLHGSRFSFVGYDKGGPMRAVEFNETEQGEIAIVMDRLVTEAELAGLPDHMSPEEMVYAREVLAAELARVAQRDATA